MGGGGSGNGHKLTMFECMSPVLLSDHLVSSGGGKTFIQSCICTKSHLHTHTTVLYMYCTYSYCGNESTCGADASVLRGLMRACACTSSGHGDYKSPKVSHYAQ